MTGRQCLLWILTASLALGRLGVHMAPAGSAQVPSKEKAGLDLDAHAVRPLLARYCFSCHGQKNPKAGLNLAAFDEKVEPRAWKPVWERLRSRQMPPLDRPQPTALERERLLGAIEAAFAKHTLDGQPDPGPLRARRLNVREHMNSFRDLAIVKANALPRRASYSTKPDGSVNLYQAIIPPPEHACAFVSRNLPQDTNDGGFDTISENLSIPPLLMEKYLRCSKLLLDDMFGLNPKLGSSYQWPLYHNVLKLQKGPLPKGMTPRQAVTAMLKEFATRAFRRPVTADEVARYARLFDRSQEKGEDFETSIRLPLQAILVSPRFVVLWSDAPAAEHDKAAVRPLDDYDLAARLSYFLWSSLPDRDLFQAAQQGRLQDSDVIEQQVRRMLRDRRITDGILLGFLCQWLQLDRLDRNAPDADRYPSYFQNNLAELMKQELLLFTDAVLVEDRSILEFLDTDWGFLCYPLAQHYGIDPFPGKKPPSNAQPPWYRVKFTDRRRGGVLTMGKVLTGTSQPVRTSPVHRGKWVLETILGTPPPPPPADVDNQLKEEKDSDKKNLTVPQLMARHRANPACYSCHQMIDPLGMAFETFDPVGKWRDRDQEQRIDARGKLVDGKEFNGIVELKALLLSRKDEFVRTFVEQMLAYALGRKLEFYDVPAVKRITQAVAQDDYRFSRVVVEVARSYPFRHRRVKERAN
jgi:hypothetical protein